MDAVGPIFGRPSTRSYWLRFVLMSSSTSPTATVQHRSTRRQHRWSGVLHPVVAALSLGDVRFTFRDHSTCDAAAAIIRLRSVPPSLRSSIAANPQCLWAPCKAAILATMTCLMLKLSAIPLLVWIVEMSSFLAGVRIRFAIPYVEHSWLEFVRQNAHNGGRFEVVWAWFG